MGHGSGFANRSLGWGVVSSGPMERVLVDWEWGVVYEAGGVGPGESRSRWGALRARWWVVALCVRFTGTAPIPSSRITCCVSKLRQ